MKIPGTHKSLRVRSTAALITFILAALAAIFFATQAFEIVEDRGDVRDHVESVQTSGKLGRVQEMGSFRVAHTRPCADGMLDVTDHPQAVRDAIQTVRSDVCGTLYETIAWNALAADGGNWMLGCFFNGTTCPTANTGFFIGLSTASPTKTSTLASGLSEITAATGYARQQTTTWTLSQSTDWRVTTNTVTFTAGGAWGAVTHMFVASVGTGTAGKLLSYAAFSQSRTLANGDSLQVTYTLTLAQHLMLQFDTALAAANEPMPLRRAA